MVSRPETRWDGWVNVTVRLFRIAVAGVVALVLAGCSPESASRAQSPVPVQPAIEQLSPSAKQATIATSFPAEVPVPMGDFTRAQAQGDSAWDYEVQVAATPEQVFDWYRTQYVAREWFVVKEGQFDAVDGGGTFLDVRKNRAESSVSVYGDDSKGYTRVKVVVGVGTPVLRTQ